MLHAALLYFQTMTRITSLLLCQKTLMNRLFSTASVLLYAAFASAWLENVTSAASGSPSNETYNKTFSIEIVYLHLSQGIVNIISDTSVTVLTWIFTILPNLEKWLLRCVILFKPRGTFLSSKEQLFGFLWRGPKRAKSNVDFFLDGGESLAWNNDDDCLLTW